MGLFDKKFCDICGAKIGLLGNRKLDDGNCCKDCAAKLSPWFTGRKKSSVEQIKAQIAYREENQKAAAEFRTTRSFGSDYKLLLDEDAKKFCVTRAGNVANSNPDILDFSMVTGCIFDIDDSQTELTTKDAQGNSVSYRPPRYEYSYDFYVTVQVNHPYFEEMRFRINDSTVDIESTTAPKPLLNPDYKRFIDMGEEIKKAVEAMRQGVRDEAAAAAAPKTAVKCPHCGATTYPQGGRCEYCGGAVS